MSNGKKIDLTDNLDDFDLDDFNFDFNDDSQTKDANGKDRSPAMQFGKSFVKEFASKSNAFNIGSIVTRNALPRSYSRALDEVRDVNREVHNIFDETVKDLEPTINIIKSATRKALPATSKFLPSKIAAKLKSFSTEDESSDYSYGSYGSSDYNANDSEINSTLQTIFGAQRIDSDMRDNTSDVHRKIEREISKKQFKHTASIQGSMAFNLSKLVGYQDSVLDKYYKKSLELQYRHYFVDKSNYELARATAADTLRLLQDIQKNTGLPNEVKVSNTEAFKNANLNAMIGIAQNSLRERLGSVPQRLISNLKREVKTFTGELNGFIGQGMQAAEMASGDAMGMGMGGSAMDAPAALLNMQVSDSIGYRLANLAKKHVPELLSKINPKLPTKLANITHDVNRIVDDAPGMIKRAITDRDSGWSWLGNLLGNDNSNEPYIAKNLSKEATTAVPWDVLSRRTLIEIIPGFLSRSLEELTNIYSWMSGDKKKTDRLVYSTKHERFVTHTEAKKATAKVFTDKISTTIKNYADAIVDYIDPTGTALVPQERIALIMQLVKDSTDDVNFDPVKYGTSAKIYDSPFMSSTTCSKVADLFREAFGIEENEGIKAHVFGRYSVADSSKAKHEELAYKFKQLKSGFGDIAPELADHLKTGESGLLQDIGLTDQKTGRVDPNWKFRVLQQLLGMNPQELNEFHETLVPAAYTPPKLDNKGIVIDTLKSRYDYRNKPNSVNDTVASTVTMPAYGSQSNFVGPLPQAASPLTGVKNLYGNITNNKEVQNIANQLGVTSVIDSYNEGKKAASEKVKELKASVTNAYTNRPKSKEEVKQLAKDTLDNAIAKAEELSEELKGKIEELEQREDVQDIIARTTEQADKIRAETKAKLEEVQSTEQYQTVKAEADKLTEKVKTSKTGTNIRKGIEVARGIKSTDDAITVAKSIGETIGNKLTDTLEKGQQFYADNKDVPGEAITKIVESLGSTAEDVKVGVADIATHISESVESTDTSIHLLERIAIAVENLRLHGGVVEGDESTAEPPTNAEAPTATPGNRGFFGTIGAGIRGAGRGVLALRRKTAPLRNVMQKGVLGATKGALGLSKKIVPKVFHTGIGVSKWGVGHILNTAAKIPGRMMNLGRFGSNGISMLASILAPAIMGAGKVGLNAAGWLGKRALNVAAKVPERLGNLAHGALAVGGFVGGKVSDLLFNRQYIQDVFIKGDLEHPALQASKLNQGLYTDADTGKVIKTIKDIKGAVKLGNDIVLTKDDIEKGLVDYRGKALPGFGLFHKLMGHLFGGKKPLGINWRSPFTVATSMVDKFSDMFHKKETDSVGMLKKIYDFLQNAFPTNGAEEKEADREGGTEEIKKERAAEKAAEEKKEKEEADKKANGTGVDKPKEGSSIADKLKNAGSVAKTAWEGIKTAGKWVGGLFGAGAEGAAGGAATGAGGAAAGGAAAAGTGVAGAAGAAEVGAGIAAAGETVAAAGTGVAGAAGAAEVGAGIAAAGETVAAGAGAVALGISPLGWAALAGTVAYAGYKLYKHEKFKAKLKPLELLRYLQYGVPVDNEGAVKAVRIFEDSVDDDVTIPWFSKTGIPNLKKTPREFWSEHYDTFGGKDDDPEAFKNFSEWFCHRFLPVYVKHNTVARIFKTDLAKIDDTLTPELKAKYVNIAQFSDKEKELGLDPFSVTSSPWPDIALADNADAVVALSNSMRDVLQRGKELTIDNIKSITPVAPYLNPAENKGIKLPAFITPKVLKEDLKTGAKAIGKSIVTGAKIAGEDLKTGVEAIISGAVGKGKQFIGWLHNGIKNAFIARGATPEQAEVYATGAAAQKILETGWNGPGKTVGQNNFFNIKETPTQKGDVPGKSAHDKVENSDDMYMGFSTPEKGLGAYVDFLIKNPTYKKHGVFNTTTPDEYADAMQAAHYATDGRYAEKLKVILHGKSLQQAINSFSGPTQPTANNTSVSTPALDKETPSGTGIPTDTAANTSVPTPASDTSGATPTGDVDFRKVMGGSVPNEPVTATAANTSVPTPVDGTSPVINAPSAVTADAAPADLGNIPTTSSKLANVDIGNGVIPQSVTPAAEPTMLAGYTPPIATTLKNPPPPTPAEIAAGTQQARDTELKEIFNAQKSIVDKKAAANDTNYLPITPGKVLDFTKSFADNQTIPQSVTPPTSPVSDEQLIKYMHTHWQEPTIAAGFESEGGVAAPDAETARKWFNGQTPEDQALHGQRIATEERLRSTIQSSLAESYGNTPSPIPPVTPAIPEVAPSIVPAITSVIPGVINTAASIWKNPIEAAKQADERAAAKTNAEVNPSPTPVETAVDAAAQADAITQAHLAGIHDTTKKAAVGAADQRDSMVEEQRKTNEILSEIAANIGKTAAAKPDTTASNNVHVTNNTVQQPAIKPMVQLNRRI